MSTTQRVGIIGGGPSGFASARALSEETKDGKAVFDITIYERRKGPGGVWEFTGKGPLYRDLDTNIYQYLMEYKDKKYPTTDKPTFVTRDEVRQYVENYSHEIEALPNVHVEYGAEVSGLEHGDKLWTLHANGEPKHFDHIIVATGHYEYPNYPKIKGLEALQAAHPEKVTHTKHYFEPSGFAGKKILVVGNGSSGVDVTIQLLSVTAPVTISRLSTVTSDGAFEEGKDVVFKPVIDHFDADGTVHFSDNTTDTYDIIVFATGYAYRAPFLEAFNAKAPKQVLDTERYERIKNLYKFIFYIPDPSLAFVGLNTQVVPMPFVESQGAVIARVWSGRLKLPSTEDMLADEQRVIASKGTGPGFLFMGYPTDVQYMHELNDWAEQAPENGFLAERWGAVKEKMRAEIAEAKLGEYARKVRESNVLRARHSENQPLA